MDIYIIYTMLAVILIGIIVIAVLLRDYIKDRKNAPTSKKIEPNKTHSIKPAPTLKKTNQPITQFKPDALPEGVALDENNLPYCINKISKSTINYGKRFNAYAVQGGKCYHRRSCKQLQGKKAIMTMHIYQAIISPLKPCSYCKPKTKIDDWYLKLFPDADHKNTNYYELNVHKN